MITFFLKDHVPKSIKINPHFGHKDAPLPIIKKPSVQEVIPHPPQTIIQLKPD